MEEIKFRAFDKREEIIVEVVTIDYDQESISVRYGDDFYWIDFKDIELLQYTGIIDKNGVEIYKGDIIKESDCNLLFEVKWQKYEAKFFLVAINPKDDEIESMDFDTDCDTELLKVIGNIYENKELKDGEQY